MFLLIHNISNSELARRIFKFHYVSINSENQDREIPNELYAFKFREYPKACVNLQTDVR